jgi:hypothetical protein
MTWTLQDFGFAPGNVEVWYVRKDTVALPLPIPAFYRIAGPAIGKEEIIPTPKALENTHVLLGTVAQNQFFTPPLKNIFRAFQGENWSPDGEARDLVEEKGTHHTSMSIGDVVVLEDGIAWLCTWSGWERLT